MYAGKKFELNVHQDGVYAPTGKTHGLLELVLPTDRCLTLKVDRDITQSGDVSTLASPFHHHHPRNFMLV